MADEYVEEPVGPWEPIDVEPVLEGRYRPPLPSIGSRSDGAGLFYPGREHTLASESEGGKTWLALHAVKTEMELGHAVLYLDFEDDVDGIVGRLLAMQTPPAVIRKLFAYVRPGVPLSDSGPDRLRFRELIENGRPSLVILDGITEAMALHGLSVLDNDNVAEFRRVLPGWLTQGGAAVVSLDHVPKSTDNRGRYAIGAAHKLNGLNGAAYVLDNRMPFGIGVTGRSRIRLAKDRPGQLRRHGLAGKEMHWYGDLVITSHNENFVEVNVEPPRETMPGEFRPTIMMGTVHAVIAEHGPISQNGIEKRVHGRVGTIRDAVKALIKDGYITPGPHTVVRPYGLAGGADG